MTTDAQKRLTEIYTARGLVTAADKVLACAKDTVKVAKEVLENREAELAELESDPDQLRLDLDPVEKPNPADKLGAEAWRDCPVENMPGLSTVTVAFLLPEEGISTAGDVADRWCSGALKRMPSIGPDARKEIGESLKKLQRDAMHAGRKTS